MAKKPQLNTDEAEGSIVVSLEPPKKSRKFSQSDENPVDVETGETLFEDIDPRFAASRLAADAADEEGEVDADEEGDEPADEDEDENLEIVDGDEPEEEDEQTSDEITDDVDEPAPKKGKWTKRLERSERATAESRAETAAIRAQLKEVTDKLTAQADDAEFTTKSKDIDGKLAAARVRQKKAIEDGNVDDQIAASEEITDLKGEKIVLTQTHETAKAELKKNAETKARSPITAMKSAAWVRRHPRYNTDAEYRNTANTLDAQVVAAGFDSQTDEYFSELDKRMAKFYPKEFAAKTKQGDAPVRRKHPASGQRREDGSTTAGRKTQRSNDPTSFDIKNGKVTLTPRHMENMRKFGLDPTDPNDAREYVRHNMKK